VASLPGLFEHYDPNENFNGYMPQINVVYIGDLFGFPDGQAGSSYIRLLCRGLIQAGYRARVLIPNPTENKDNPINTHTSGRVDGIDFEYTNGTPFKPTALLNRKWSRLRSRLGTQLRLVQLKKYGELDCVILYSRSYQRLLEIRRICSVLNTPLITHLTEWRQNEVNSSKEETRNANLFYSEVFEHVDAVIVISHFLEELANSASLRQSIPLPIIRIPVLADPQKFVNIHPIQRNRPYLLYCARLDGYIEDALFVIRAVACLKRDDLDLVLVGKVSRVSQERIYQAAQESHFAGKIHLECNFLPDDKLYKLYAGAEALLAPLQENEVSRARFPFKLAGYLASGAPVVSCQVGEVARYLEDGKSAFLSRPGDLDHFSKKIAEALISPNRIQVAFAGQQVAREHFDYCSQGDHLKAFIQQLIISKSGKR